MFIYTAIIKPILYGAVIWWPKISQTTTTLLKKMRRTACLPVTGEMKTTSTKANRGLTTSNSPRHSYQGDISDDNDTQYWY